jgi:hypothetical protein
MERHHVDERPTPLETARVRTVVTTTVWLNVAALGAGIFIAAAIALFSGGTSALIALPALVSSGVLAVYACVKVASDEATGRTVARKRSSQSEHVLHSLS